MSKDSQMRKANITINNPKEIGLDLATLDKKVLDKLKPQYYCRSQEIGESGTEHFHVAIYRPSPIRFSTLKRLLPTAHIEKAYGSMKENRDYIMKGGKWVTDSKADTSVPGTFAEFGTMPTEQEETSPKMAVVVEGIMAGKTTTEIVLEHPEVAFHSQQIGMLRETIRTEEVEGKFRTNLEVTYLYGKPGTGKTRSIFAKHNARDICRITSYGKDSVRFDAYHGQSVLVFEEFASQIPLSDMLNYLDIYPVMLPARYSDRSACYTTVYITSNLPLEMQYHDDFLHDPNRRDAFYRRIHHVIEFQENGKIIVHKGGTNHECT